MELSLNYEFHNYLFTSCFIQDQLHLPLQVSSASVSMNAQTFSGYSEWGLLFISVHRLLLLQLTGPRACGFQ